MFVVFVVFFVLLQDGIVAQQLPQIAPKPPNFSEDFSNDGDPLPAIDGVELEDLRSNDFQSVIHNIVPPTKFANQKIGRDPPVAMMEEMMEAKSTNFEDISEFSFDSTEFDETLPGSSKFDALAHVDSDVRVVTPMAPMTPTPTRTSTNMAATPSSQAPEDFRSETSPITPTPTPSTTSTIRDRFTPFTILASTPNSQTPHGTSSTPITPTPPPIIIRDRFTPLTILASTPNRQTPPEPTTPTTRPTPQRILFASRTFLSSSSTIVTPSTNLVTTTTTPTTTTTTTSSSTTTTPPFPPTNPPRHRTKFETQFRVKHRNEGATNRVRDRIRSTSQLLDLLGDRIAGIDQQFLTNTRTIQGAHPIRHHKQWGRTSAGRVGLRHVVLDGQMYGGSDGGKRKRVGYTIRKRFGAIPHAKRHVFLQTERRKPRVNVGETQRSLAQTLLETEDNSLRALKTTLEQIRGVVDSKPDSTSSFTGEFRLF